MADQDLEIRVRTTADLEALRQAEEEVKNFYAGPEGTSTFPLAPIPEGLTQAEGAFAAGSAGYTGLTSAAAATERIAEAGKQAGTNFLSAATHAAILARGLSSGHLELRAMTVLARNLSGEYLAMGGAVAAVGLSLLAAVKTAEEELKYRQEIGKEYDEIIKKAQELSEIARNVTTEGGVTKALEAALPEVEKLDAKLKEMHETDLKGWQKVVDFLSHGPLFGDPYASQRQSRIEDQQKLVTQAEDLSFHTLKQAEAYKAAYDAIKAEDSVTALTEVSEKISELTSKQQALNTTTLDGQKEYVRLAKEIENLKKEYDELYGIQEKRKSEADKAYDSADENVRRVLQNEKASNEARSAGASNDADMYQKSADAYKEHLSPALQDQLAKLRELQRLAYGGPEKPPEIQYSQGEEGTGGPSLVGPSAERQRLQQIDQTSRDSQKAIEDRLTEIRELQREMLGIWR